MANQLDVIVMSYFSLSIISDAIRSGYPQILNASQEVGISDHVSEIVKLIRDVEESTRSKYSVNDNFINNYSTSFKDYLHTELLLVVLIPVDK